MDWRQTWTFSNAPLPAETNLVVFVRCPPKKKKQDTHLGFYNF